MKQQFLDRWAQYFPGAELPLVLYYADEPGIAERVQARMQTTQTAQKEQ